MYQSITTKDYSLLTPQHAANASPVSYVIPIPGCAQGGSILRLGIETALAVTSGTIDFELFSGLQSVSASAFPFADDAYLITEGQLVAGSYHAQFSLNELLYVIKNNLGNLLSHALYLRITFTLNANADPVALKVKMDTAVAVTT